ncbi:MAG: hypothetical protein ACLP50_12815 [Solirubrobacteraceae bacterium]
MHGNGRIGRLGVALVSAAALSAAVAAGASADYAVTPAGYPAASGVLTSVLKPLTPLTGSPAAPAAPAVLPVITCSTNLKNYVHWSKPSQNTSWHWDYTCDDAVTASAYSTLYYQNFPVAYGPATDDGITGDFNPRYNGCLKGYWYGSAQVTYSAPNHTSASVSGYSPTNDITSCN